MPIVADLDAAMMQTAVSVPAVRRLGGGTIRLNDAGRPLRATGHDAVVYEMRAPSGRILALRCLVRPESERDLSLADRYLALREDPHLETLRRAGGALPRDILWLSEGVVLHGHDVRETIIPLMAMERVPGRTMARVVDRLCHAEESDPLALLADRWLETATVLDGAGFIHGDLAADNLMVRPDGTIALVDLDTALWPSAQFAELPHAGTAGYHHPQGQPRDPALRDRFSALIVWASLRILTRHPGLRLRWGDPPDRHGAALLWTDDDLRRPDRSSLFATIDSLDDPSLRPLVEIVRRAIHFSPDDTPSISEIAARLEELGFPRRASSPGKIVRRFATTASTVDATLAPIQPRTDPEASWSQQLDPAAGVLDVSVPRPIASDPSTEQEMPPKPLDRERRVALAREIAAAVAARDAKTALKLWSDAREVPEAAIHGAAVHLLISAEVASAIERAMRRNDDAGLILAVSEAERAGIAPSPEARTASRVARTRVAAHQRLQVSAASNDYPAIAALNVLGKLDGLGHLEPAQARAVARAMAWPALERALERDDDEAIVAAADPALWREEQTLPEGAWLRLDLARRRLRWTEDVRAALRRRDGPVLRGLIAGAPHGAEERLTEVESRRILRLTMREATVARLERALREGPDREVVAALAEFESAGAPFSDMLDWSAVRGVVDRITLADAIRAASSTEPPDTEKLARLLPAARVALGDGRAGSGPDWAVLERTVLQAAHFARLREAVASGDDARIASAADPDPYGTIELLSDEERDLARAALRRNHTRRREGE